MRLDSALAFHSKLRQITKYVGTDNKKPDCIPFREVHHTKVKAVLKNALCSEKGVKVRHYLGGDTSLSFSEAGSPPTPQ
jgi:hypothetical protein